VGPGEGELDLVAWPGYAEDGSNDPRFDWVHPFERRTGCRVTVRYVTTADEVVAQLRQRGIYDGGSVSSDAAGRLIDSEAVAEVNSRLVPNLRNIVRPLRSADFDTVQGRDFGVPFLYGPNLLLFNTKQVRGVPTSWGVTWSPDSPYRGRVMIYDAPIFIADAALYLKAHDRGLGIRDPYELTAGQLDAAAALLRRQSEMDARYWSTPTDEVLAFAAGKVVLGTGRPQALGLIRSVPVSAVLPSEGATGWADTWMVSATARHPNCMYLWMEWTLTPRVQDQMARWIRAAPANPRACELLRRTVGAAASTLRYGRCGDVRFLSSLYLWKTPQEECGDGRTECMAFRDWNREWESIREART
jgi:putative spermidine/putrescine transport system substrate-binding protein